MRRITLKKFRPETTSIDEIKIKYYDEDRNLTLKKLQKNVKISELPYLCLNVNSDESRKRYPKIIGRI